MRAFLAMEIGDDVIAAATEVGRRIDAIVGPWGWKIGWTRPEKMHLTLKFFGNVAPDRVPAISDALAPVCGAHSPMHVALAGVGTFPERGAPHVVWIGVADPSGAIASLFRDAEDRLEAIGIPREERPLHAHVTLGRVKTPGNVRFSDALPSIGPADCGAAHLDALTLFESQLKTGTYHVLKRIPLRGEPR